MSVPENPGIYLLTHVPTGRYYIGSTNNLYLRDYQQRYSITRNVNGFADRFTETERNLDDFTFDFELHESREEAYEMEKALLRSNVGLDLCINKSYFSGSLQHHSEETKRTLSLQRTGVARSDDAKISISLGKSRKVSLDGVVYGSCYIAAIELGIGSRALRQRLSANTPRWKNWFFLD